MKWLIYAIFIVLYLGVTFLGLGPVLYADGFIQERMLTLGIVLLIYVSLKVLFLKWRRRKS